MDNSKLQWPSDSKTIHYVVKEIRVSDVEDPDLIVGQPIYEWQQTEKGKWCMKHCDDLHWNWWADVQSFGYQIAITGTLHSEDLTYFLLKWGEQK